MEHLSFLIKPASSLCNLRCDYCFYADVSSRRTVKSFGIMSEDTAAACIERIFSVLKTGDRVTFAFQGGEPTLAGLLFFKRFVELVAAAKQHFGLSISVDWALQTNGMVLDEPWCRFLGENRFLVGLSLDGGRAAHDSHRLDPRGRGTHRQVLAAKALLERHQVEYNILWVLTNGAARTPQQAWDYLVAQDIRFVQFIPCLGSLDTPSKNALTPQRFASFFTGLFRPWSEALARGDYRSIKQFDDLCNLLGKGTVTACGITGQCQQQMVVEADGSVYPCDFYVLDQYRCGSLCSDTPHQLQKSPITQAFLHRPREDTQRCQGCTYLPLCGGGCPRMHNAVYWGEGQSCGFRMLLDAVGGPLQTIGRRYGQ